MKHWRWRSCVSQRHKACLLLVYQHCVPWTTRLSKLICMMSTQWTSIVSDHRRYNCESKQQNKTTCQCTPVDSHLHYLLMYTRRCTPGLHLDVHLDYLLMDSCRCTRGLLVDVHLSGYQSTHIYETACSCICMRPPVNSHPQDTTPVAPRLQCESKNCTVLLL